MFVSSKFRRASVRVSTFIRSLRVSAILASRSADLRSACPHSENSPPPQTAALPHSLQHDPNCLHAPLRQQLTPTKAILRLKRIRALGLRNAFVSAFHERLPPGRSRNVNQCLRTIMFLNGIHAITRDDDILQSRPIFLLSPTPDRVPRSGPARKTFYLPEIATRGARGSACTCLLSSISVITDTHTNPFFNLLLLFLFFFLYLSLRKKEKNKTQEYENMKQGETG